MKIAYILLAFNYPVHFKRLIQSLDHPDNGIYVHIDRKSDLNLFTTAVNNHIYYEQNRHTVYWGEFSQVEAQLKLLRKAVRKRYDYYVLLYGSDYPVRSQSYIRSYLSKRQSEYINLVTMPGFGKTLDRIEYYRFLGANRVISLPGLTKRLINRSIRALHIKRPLPDGYRHLTLYGGSPWWVLTSACTRYILNFINNNPRLHNFWRNTLIPDETYFHTILGNSEFRKHVRPNVLYTNWIHGESNPRIVTEADLNAIRKGRFTNDFGTHDILFARKFDDSSTPILERIHREFL